MAIQKAIVASIVPNEVLFPNSTLMIESRVALDQRSAQSGIVIHGKKGQVQLSRGAPYNLVSRGAAPARSPHMNEMAATQKWMAAISF